MCEENMPRTSATEQRPMPTKRSISDRALRRWFPKRYIRKRMRWTEIEHREKLRAAESRNDRRSLEASHNFDMLDLEDWLTRIEDHQLITKAGRMDLSLDDIPEPQGGPDDTPGHWHTGDTGSRILYSDSRLALQKAIRERAPAYRKERREVYEFYSKIVRGVGGVLTGIGGTIIGIISVLKK